MDTLYVVVKCTFDIFPLVKVSEVQIPPTIEDSFWGEPIKNSIKNASEMHVGKSTTDIILNGHAYAPNEKGVDKLDLFLSVGNNQQRLSVIGDRQWHKGKATKPIPFEKVALVYENAYGGEHVSHKKDSKGELREVVIGEVCNPIGKGFIGKRAGADIDGMPLPNLEDPRQLITRPQHSPVPLCFGYIAPSWQPRVQYAGTYDEKWKKNRAPYLPSDFSKRFFNMAHSSMVSRQFLLGGEAVRMVNSSLQGEINFNLPACAIEAKVVFEDRVEIPPLDLETVQLEPDHNRFTLTWRGRVTCDKEALRIKQVDIDLLSTSLQQVVA
ncbi:MAG: DUF2169 domain-containing protein [Pseudomonadales bacterium]|nr:DUF2169 domain-containing protein [Pseudomonadales bacterium]